MNRLARTAVGVFTTAAVIIPLNAAAAASPEVAGGKHWTTVESLFGAKQQACKVGVDDGAAWKIHNRLDGRNNTTGRVAATMTATRHGTPVDARRWRSGWVGEGEVSAVGTFKVPRAAGWALTMTLSGDEAGTGGELQLSGVGRC